MKGITPSLWQHIKCFSIVLLAFVLFACSPPTQLPIITSTETLSPSLEPTSTKISATPTFELTSTPSSTSTSEPSENAAVAHTILRIEFPFEPAFPGYLVDVKSTAFTANLMCALEQGHTTGQVIEVTQNTNDIKYWGTCDTSSMTLDVLIPDQITVTVILGGFPMVNEVTKTPDSVTEQEAEYYFEYRFK